MCGYNSRMLGVVLRHQVEIDCSKHFSSTTKTVRFGRCHWGQGAHMSAKSSRKSRLNQDKCCSQALEGSGLPNRYPWEITSALALRKSACSWVSTPSATISSFIYFATARIVSTSIAESGLVGASWIKVLSIFNSWMGRRL